MGLLDKLLTNMPGSPVKIAKIMLRAYNTYKVNHPTNSKSDALRYTLESRYRIFKLMKPEEMKSILSEADTLGHLAFLVVAHENPAAVHPVNMKQTVLDLYEFFSKNAPDELGGLDALKATVSASEQKNGLMKDEKVQELMKSLCLGIVGDIGRLLSDKGFNKPIRIIELIVFGMFIVTETYSLAKKKSEKAEPQLDQFHLDMTNYVTKEYFLKDNKDVDEIFELQDKFYDLVGIRYKEYRQLFSEDWSNPGTTFSKTVGAFIRHLFDEPVSEDDKRHLIVVMHIKLLEFYAGCLQSFK